MWPGFIFDEKSNLSLKVSNSKEMQNQIKKQYNFSTKNFNSNKIYIFFSKDKNLNLALAHATILEPRIDNNGMFKGWLFDKYDFAKENYSIDLKTQANNYFYGIQERHKDKKNFYIIVPIEFKW